MKIGVLLKQVPDTETRIKIRADNLGIEEGDIKWVINPYDEYAVEEALRLKEKVGGEVVIVSAGPPRAMEAIRQALAMGADSAILIDTRGIETDPLITSLILSAAIKNESFEIIFAGKQAVDDDCAQVLIGVAEKLGWPHVSPVEKFEFKDGKVFLQRPVAGGTKEIIETAPPLVVGCEKGLNEPRYATLPGIMKAKSKPVKNISAKDLIGNERPRILISAYSLPPERKAGRIIKGEPEEAVAELVRLLREEAKII